MAATISDAVLDAALNFLETNGTVVHILTQAITLWSEVATYTKGNKTGCTYTGPVDHTTGRKTTLDAITGGSVTGSGTVTHFAITNGSSDVYVCQALNASQAVTSGNTFTLTAAIIAIPDPTA
jgi:hypothetical protein